MTRPFVRAARRGLVPAVLAALLAVPATASAQADAWPSKPVRIIVPANAGGGTANPVRRFFAEALKYMRLLRAELGPDVPIMITTFDPFQQVTRRVGYTKAKFVFEHPDEAIPMLERVCDALCDYMHAVREAGCDAVFYSIDGAITPPAKRGIDDATYRTFVRPCEIRMAEAMAGMVRVLHVLHVHGSSLTVERVLDYPFEVLSVSDRLKGNPTQTPWYLLKAIGETVATVRARRAGPRRDRLGPSPGPRGSRTDVLRSRSDQLTGPTLFHRMGEPADDPPRGEHHERCVGRQTQRVGQGGECRVR